MKPNRHLLAGITLVSLVSSVRAAVITTVGTNAIVTNGTATVDLGFTMSFSGPGGIEIITGMLSRSTYAANRATAVNFRAPATFSDTTTSVINYSLGGTAGASDTFLHFVAPTGKTISSFGVTWLSKAGASPALANGQRRPVMDDFGFVVIPEPSSALLLLSGAHGFALRR